MSTIAVYFRRLVFIIAVSSDVSSLVAQPIDLKQVISFAVANNTQIKTRLMDRSVHLHELRFIKQKFYPQVLFNMSVTARHEDYFNEDFIEKKVHTYPTLKMLTPIGTSLEIFTEQNVGYEQGGRRTGSALRIVMEQPLLQGRKRIVNTWSIDNAQLLDEIQQLLYQQSLEQLIYSVIIQYHALQLCKENVKLKERWVQNAQRLYENLKIQVESGRAANSDLNSSLLQVNQVEGYLAQAKYEHQQMMRKLLELIGSEDEEIALKEVVYEKQDFFIEPSRFMQLVTHHDIETKILNLNKQRMVQQVIVAKDQQQFDLKLRGDWTIGRYHVFGSNHFGSEDLDENANNYPVVHQNGNYSAQILLSIPLTGKDQRYHQVLVAKQELKKVELESKDHERELKHQMNGLLEQFSLKKQQIKLAMESEKLAEKTYEDALMKLEAGRSSIFEIVTIREKLHDTQMAYYATLMAYLDVQAQLEYSAGLLSKKWLGAVK